MFRSRVAAAVAALLIVLFGAAAPAEAGKMLYQDCFTSRGNATDGVKATLQAGGLFYNWAGYLVNETVASNFKVCNPTTQIFKDSNANGQNSFTIPTFANNVKVPLNGHMILKSIRNNTALDLDQMKTTLTIGQQPSGTKIGEDPKPRAVGDPEIYLTNDDTSVITLVSMVAQIDNSQDPLDPDLFFFVPDGASVPVSPTLNSMNNTLALNASAIFSFPIGNAQNWSFQLTYMFDGDTYNVLLATDVAEPGSALLLTAALAAWPLVGSSRRSRSMARRAHRTGRLWKGALRRQVSTRSGAISTR
jgi:hypothetical protein